MVLRPEDIAQLGLQAITKRINKQSDAHKKYMGHSNTVRALEKALRVPEDGRWTPDSAPYRATVEKITRRDYMRAVDRLEFLMLQRMFELNKTHSYGTGTHFLSN